MIAAATPSQGRVYLMGAGPGDVAYLTQQALQILARADVVIYDGLVNPQLLNNAPGHCQCIEVSKRWGQANYTQAQIEQLMVQYCQQGLQVVRLKSGDPLIFGRSAGEIAALQASRCDFMLVPGLSSALAAPLLAGIPLTDAEVSRCLAIFSGHEPAKLPWASLAGLETLVILMGTQHLEEVVTQLQQYGRSPQTAIAVIHRGGWPEQQTWFGTLATIPEQTAGVDLAPAVIVIGAVVNRRFSTTEQHQVVPRQLPLQGKTILVTRAASQSETFCAQLQQLGATVLSMPALEIGPPTSWQPLDQAITHLQDFDWVLLTSTNGVDAFWHRLLHQGQDVRSLAGLQIAVVGRKTADYLEQRGLKPDFVPTHYVADNLATELLAGEDLSGLKMLFPRVETGGRDALVAALTTRGAALVEVPAYESRRPAQVDPLIVRALQNRTVDAVTFASSKTVQYFCQLLDQAVMAQPGTTTPTWQAWLAGSCITSIGPQTSATCQQYLGRVDVEAQEYTLDGLTQALMARWSAQA